jgi:hypothetical protein
VLSDRLREFVAIWCDVDADINQVARLLRKHPDDGWALWLQDDLRQAIEGKDFTPELAYELTSIGFDDQAEVDAWLHDCWTTWFPDDPYPGE